MADTNALARDAVTGAGSGGLITVNGQPQYTPPSPEAGTGAGTGAAPGMAGAQFGPVSDTAAGRIGTADPHPEPVAPGGAATGIITDPAVAGTQYDPNSTNYKPPTTEQTQAASAASTPMTPEQAADIYKKQIAAGKEMAGTIDLGRIGTDPATKAALDAITGAGGYTEMLKGRLEGLNSDEMRAAREQATTQINRQMAQNQERYASLMGGQGIQGGANAAMQERALALANEQNNQAQRQLILDNINQKNLASAAYGGQLGQNVNTALGMENTNLGLRGQEQYYEHAAPLQYAAGIQGVQSADTANKNSAAGLNILQDYVKATGNPANSSSTPTTDTGSIPYKNKADAKAALITKLMQGGSSFDDAQQVASDPQSIFANEHGYASFADMPNELKIKAYKELQ